jgi:cytochrome c
LVFLLLNWTAETIYSTEAAHGDHAEAAYVIEVEDDDAHADAEVETVDIAALVAAADAGKGAKVFSKCKACHKLESGANATGPHLFGIFDRDIASADGFGYSGTLAGLEGNWTAEALDGFLASPKKYAPGTKMSFAGLKKQKDRANLIAYLQSVGN